MEKLHNECSEERYSAVQILGYLRNPSENVIPTLLNLLHHDKDGFVRASAVEALVLQNIDHDVLLSHLLKSFGNFTSLDASYLDEFCFNSQVSEALVRLSKSFDPVTPALAQWIEQNQDKEYVEYGIDALLKMVGEY